MGNKNKLPNIMNTDQLVQLFDGMTEVKVAVASFIAFFCGLRISEVCNIQINNVDLVTKVLKVTDSKNTNRKEQGGYGKDRFVVMPDSVVPVLRKWIELINGGKWLFSSDKSPDKAMTKKTLDCKFRQALKNAGMLIVEEELTFKVKAYDFKLKKKTRQIRVVPRYKYHFHNLRHSYATYLINKGVDVVTIKDTLGHERFDTTMVYAKVAHERKATEINRAFSVQARQQVIPQQQVQQYTQPSQTQDPIQFLQMQMIQGKIDEEEYQRKIALLQGRPEVIQHEQIKG